MTKIVKLLFFVYRGITLGTNPTCRFKPTCSKYAVEAIEKYGFFRGSLKAARRLLNCHPLSQRPIYDPA